MTTAVEWLINKIQEQREEGNTDLRQTLHYCEQAKQMEDDYKYEAYKEGLFNGITAYVHNDEKLALEELLNKTLNEIKISESINLKTEYLKDEDCINLSFKIDGKNFYFDVYLDDLQVVCNIFENKKQMFHETIEGIKKEKGL